MFFKLTLPYELSSYIFGWLTIHDVYKLSLYCYIYTIWHILLCHISIPLLTLWRHVLLKDIEPPVQKHPSHVQFPSLSSFLLWAQGLCMRTYSISALQWNLSPFSRLSSWMHKWNSTFASIVRGGRVKSHVPLYTTQKYMCTAHY